MDPLLPINKAYNLAQQVKKHKHITCLPVDPPTTFYSQTHNNGLGNGRNDFRKPRDLFQRKFCDFCKSKGHTFETCFEIVGYPDWWKGLRKGSSQQQMGKKISRHANFAQENTVGNPLDNETTHTNLDQQLLPIVCQEVCKLITSKVISQSI